MNDCLRQFILSLNQLQFPDANLRRSKKINRYLKKMTKEWRKSSNERRQSEEAFLKIVR
ncbi:MAG: hypothetical protein GX075_04790 [Firmicutes bacterium]|nr:hypothetical protein [Bacillota bacterium]